MTERPPHSPCRRNDHHDAHEFQVYGRPFWCRGFTPTEPAAVKPSVQPRLFHLQRDHDVSGVSGTGRVANGVLWPDGTVSLRWIGERPSTVHWDRLADAEHVHGHGGATRIMWADEEAVTSAVILLAAAEELEQYVGRQSSSAAPEIEGARLVIRQVRRMGNQGLQQLPDGFRRLAVVAAECTVCEYEFDEDESYTVHFESVDQAHKALRDHGWTVLLDGRVVCDSDEPDHQALRPVAEVQQP